MDGAGAGRRFEKKCLTAGPQFPLGAGQVPGEVFAGDLQVMPGHAETVAVARRSNGVAIYDNGVPRPKMVSWTDFVDIIAFGRSADRLYGTDTQTSGAAFTRMAIDAMGLTVLDKGTRSGLGAQMKFADGLIYGSSGLRVDPETRPLPRTFPAVPYHPLLPPAPPPAP